MSKRNGILCGGNWIIDHVKIIDSYPSLETLANIISSSLGNGGSPYNVLKDLAKLKADFPLEGLGIIGNDNMGEVIVEDCKSHGINIDLIKKKSDQTTSYTDVMSILSNGKRTFFHNRGANSLLDISDFELEKSNAKIFHLGYLLLLDKLDTLLDDGLTGAAHVLKNAQETGFLTSADSVSENSNRFSEIVPLSLPFIDFFFLNEFEAQKITGVSTNLNGELSITGCIKAAKQIIKLGVKKWVILHFSDGAVAVSREGKVYVQGRVQLPKKLIKGTVGAGDAFAAGVLFALHDNSNIKKALKLGVCTAATCLLQPDCSDGILPWEEALEIGDLYGFKQLS